AASDARNSATRATRSLSRDLLSAYAPHRQACGPVATLLGSEHGRTRWGVPFEVAGPVVAPGSLPGGPVPVRQRERREEVRGDRATGTAGDSAGRPGAARGQPPRYRFDPRPRARGAAARPGYRGDVPARPVGLRSAAPADPDR